MNPQLGLERCLSFINCQLRPGAKPPSSAESTARWRAVTISRQTGAGGHVIAEKLAEYLEAHAPKNAHPWTVFDRNLVEKVLEDHHLPQRLARFMLEDRISEVSDTMDELFGLHPPSWTLVRQTAETILHLVQLGHVIIIGRGGHVITRKLDYVFHVRLVGSLEKRVEHMQQVNQLTPKAALDLITREDRGRRRYLRKYFNLEIDDPLLYHLIINTDVISYDQAARMIGLAVLDRT